MWLRSACESNLSLFLWQWCYVVWYLLSSSVRCWIVKRVQSLMYSIANIGWILSDKLALSIIYYHTTHVPNCTFCCYSMGKNVPICTTIIVHVSKSFPTMIAGPTHLVVKASSDSNIRAERLVWPYEPDIDIELSCLHIIWWLCQQISKWPDELAQYLIFCGTLKLC